MADFDVEVGVVVVVVLVAGVVVVVVASDDDEVPSSDVVVGVLVVTAEDVEPSLDDVVVVVELDAALLAPGCSLATTTPIRAVDAAAAITAERVMRRRRTLARWRESGECGPIGGFMGCLLSPCSRIEPSPVIRCPSASCASNVALVVGISARILKAPRANCFAQLHPPLPANVDGTAVHYRPIRRFHRQ